MDILKRQIAPITEEAWEEIDEMARKVLKTNLSARKFVEVNGPLGWDFAAVNTGRLGIYGGKKESEVCYGVHSIQPLTELRKSFSLNIWELDNALRGAKDVDLDNVVDASKQIADFEEKAIYGGFQKGSIKGLSDELQYDVVKLKDDKKQIINAISGGITTLIKQSVSGPYILAVSSQIWELISEFTQGYPLKKHIEALLGGEIILSPSLEGAFLVSTRGGDLELTIGADFSIGYESHDSENVNLFITESFTFRVLDPTVFVKMEIVK